MNAGCSCPSTGTLSASGTGGSKTSTACLAGDFWWGKRDPLEVHSRVQVRGDVCGKAEEATNFYLSVFKSAPDRTRTGESKADVLARYGKGEEPDKEGSVRYAHFSLLGQEFGAIDSGREHKFASNEAISFIVPCDTQEQIDYFWGKLSADPKAEQCGWLKDKYGLSWQITPAVLRDLLGRNDQKRIERVT